MPEVDRACQRYLRTSRHEKRDQSKEPIAPEYEVKHASLIAFADDTTSLGPAKKEDFRGETRSMAIWWVHVPRASSSRGVFNMAKGKNNQ